MSNWYNDDVKALFEAMSLLKTEKEYRLFFEDVCTIKEISDIAQRLKVAKLLRAKASYALINQETGISTATISRVSRCLDYGAGGYDLVLERLDKREDGNG
jgi:TrpR-related protein YerC/YecD